MKLKYLLLGALVGVAFTACTNDDEPANVNANQKFAGKYMAVKFVMPGSTTRADSWTNDGGFEEATGDEISVTGAKFLFFDGETQVADIFDTAELDETFSETLNSESKTWNKGDGSIDKQSNMIIVLKNAVKNPTSIVAILNTASVPVTRSTTMTQLLAMNDDYRNDTGANFVMTNSVYKDGDKVIVGTPVESKNICATTEEAAVNPVKIAVEKTVAKVELSNDSGDTDTDKTTKAGKKISVEVKGWWLDNTNPKSFLVKNLESTYTETGSWDWNDTPNFRSYWATSFAPDAYEHGKLSDAIALEESIYALENTDQLNPTQIVVSAQLSVEGEAEGTTIVQYLSERYTQKDFETALYATISTKYFTRSGEGTSTSPYKYDSVKQDALTFTYKTNTATETVQFEGEDLKDYEALVEVSYSGDPLFTQESGSWVPVDLTTAFTSLSRKVHYWLGGQTYYFAAITQNEDIPVTGVVRNHLYKINIKAIEGLGTPIAETASDNEIIPVIPVDNESYISAEILILKYKVITMDIDLDATK